MYNSRLEKLSPLESSIERPRFHEILLKNEQGNSIGQAKLEYSNTLCPTYYITFLEVAEGLEGRGFGTQLVQSINSYIVSKKALGVLYVLNRSLISFYEKNGWTSLEGTDFMVFNRPEYINENDMNKLLFSLKESWKRTKD